jgi:hypothetical protein
MQVAYLLGNLERQMDRQTWTGPYGVSIALEREKHLKTYDDGLCPKTNNHVYFSAI